MANTTYEVKNGVWIDSKTNRPVSGTISNQADNFYAQNLDPEKIEKARRQDVADQEKIVDKEGKQREKDIKSLRGAGDEALIRDVDPETAEKIRNISNNIFLQETRAANDRVFGTQPSTQLNLGDLPSSPSDPSQSTFTFGGQTQTVEDILKEIDAQRTSDLEQSKSLGNFVKGLETPTQDLFSSVAPPPTASGDAPALPSEDISASGSRPARQRSDKDIREFLNQFQKPENKSVKGSRAERRAASKAGVVKKLPALIQSKGSRILQSIIPLLPQDQINKINSRIADMKGKVSDEQILNKLEEKLLGG